jgi:hypothetical protein
MLDETNTVSRRKPTGEYVRYLEESRCYELSTTNRFEDSVLRKINDYKMSPSLIESNRSTTRNSNC